MKTIYTIGYATFNVKQFIDILKKYDITCVIDVRSVAYSKYYSDYNKEVLEKKLKTNKILYRNYFEEFGAKQTEECYLTSEGYLDFNKYVKSDKFEKGYKKIVSGMKKGYLFTLMCAEINPLDCHRSIMLGREFQKRGLDVRNILKCGEYITQVELEEQLLDIYFPGRNQISIFNENTDKKALIKEAYDIKNKEIGYRLNV